MFSALSHIPLTVRTGHPSAVQLKPTADGASKAFNVPEQNRGAPTQGGFGMASGREAS